MENGLDYCYVQVLVNMNEQDINEWTGGYCCGDGYLCYVLFLVVFLEMFFRKGQLITRVLLSFPSILYS